MNTPSDKGIQNQQNLLFGIAGINTLVTSNNTDLILGLHMRYASYTSQGDNLLHVKIDYIGQKRTSSVLDTDTRFKDGICHFFAPGYEGFIDSRSGIGELVLSSKRPLEDVEYFIRVAYALLSFDAGGIMFHAAGIVRGSKAHLFFGHSGSGKTTVARVSKDDIVLNDDLLILMPKTSEGPQASRWVAYATPFWNPTQVAPTNQYAPVNGLYRLVQDQDVFLEPMSPGQALGELVSNVPVIPDDPSRSEDLLQRCANLIGDIPVNRLHFLPDSSFWDVVNAGGGPDRIDS